MKCMATVLMVALVLLILAPAVIRAVTFEAVPQHADVTYASPFDTVAPSASPSRLPLPAGTGDLIGIAVYAVIVAGLLGLILVISFVVALLRRQPIARSRHVRGQMEVEETRVMQEIYRSLGKMENRIEALETLLLDRTKTGEYFEPAGSEARRP